MGERTGSPRRRCPRSASKMSRRSEEPLLANVAAFLRAAGAAPRRLRHRRSRPGPAGPFRRRSESRGPCRGKGHIGDTINGNQVIDRGKLGRGGGRKPCPAQAHRFESSSTSASPSPLDPLSGFSDKRHFRLNAPLRTPKPSCHGSQARSGAREPSGFQCRPRPSSSPRCTHFALRSSKTPQMRSLQQRNSRRYRPTLSNSAGSPWSVPRRPMMIYGLSRSL